MLYARKIHNVHIIIFDFLLVALNVRQLLPRVYRNCVDKNISAGIIWTILLKGASKRKKYTKLNSIQLNAKRLSGLTSLNLSKILPVKNIKKTNAVIETNGILAKIGLSKPIVNMLNNLITNGIVVLLGKKYVSININLT